MLSYPFSRLWALWPQILGSLDASGLAQFLGCEISGVRGGCSSCHNLLEDWQAVRCFEESCNQSRNGLKINFIKSTAHQSFARRLTEIILKLRKLHKKLALS